MTEEGTILFVEDNDSLREVLSRVLERGGYRVLQAESAEAAYGHLQQNGAIDMVITDVVMSGEGVRGLVERVKAAGGASRLLIISGHPLGGGARTYGVAGAEFMLKPFTPQELLGRVDRMLGHVR
jgi:DNA-binding NtrC family response regulator